VNGGGLRGGHAARAHQKVLHVVFWKFRGLRDQLQKLCEDGLVGGACLHFNRERHDQGFAQGARGGGARHGGWN
jgi:hypothetical protein